MVKGLWSSLENVGEDVESSPIRVNETAQALVRKLTYAQVLEAERQRLSLKNEDQGISSPMVISLR